MEKVMTLTRTASAYAAENARRWTSKLDGLEALLTPFVSVGTTYFYFDLPDDGCKTQWEFFPMPKGNLSRSLIPVGWTADLIERLHALGFDTELERGYIRLHTDRGGYAVRAVLHDQLRVGYERIDFKGSDFQLSANKLGVTSKSSSPKPTSLITAWADYLAENTRHWNMLLEDGGLEYLLRPAREIGTTCFHFTIPDNGCKTGAWQFFNNGKFSPGRSLAPVGWTRDLIQHLRALGFDTELKIDESEVRKGYAVRAVVPNRPKIGFKDFDDFREVKIKIDDDRENESASPSNNKKYWTAQK